MKKVMHIFEAAIAKSALFIFSMLPFSTASNIGGFLGRLIGPHMKATKTARRNIKISMPDLTDTRVEEIITGMWDNLGRVITEYSHMDKMTLDNINKLVTVDGQQNLDALAKEEGGLFVTGHFSNWEMVAATAFQKGCPFHIVYRKANNPYVDKIIYDLRTHYSVSSSAKGPVGARQIIGALKKKHIVGMLVDQKQNDGISVPLFGRNAMTAPAVATLALKYDCAVYPGRTVRVNGHKFRFIVGEPLKFERTGNNEVDTLALMTKINSLLEGWIREYPEQWFWVHNRWPKENA